MVKRCVPISVRFVQALNAMASVMSKIKKTIVAPLLLSEEAKATYGPEVINL